jgi:hypothetical protein
LTQDKVGFVETGKINELLLSSFKQAADFF